MSEWNHFKARLRPVNIKGTLVDQVRIITDYLSDGATHEERLACIEEDGIYYHLSGGVLYDIEIELTTDIYKGTINGDGSIDIEVCQYNRGESVAKAIETAIRNAK